MDERFILHRLYSTRFAAVVTIVIMGIWFNYEYFINNHLRRDFFVFIMVMALSKVCAMLYYRLTN